MVWGEARVPVSMDQTQELLRSCYHLHMGKKTRSIWKWTMAQRYLEHTLVKTFDTRLIAGSARL